MLKSFIAVLFIIAVLLGILVINQFFIVRKAHSTFDNYYAFRGCTKLLQKTATYGVCKTSSGKIIKIVEVKGKWYLDGDLPVCYGSFCL